MNRKKRTEILVRGSSNLSRALARQILENHEVITIETPNNGLVMVKVREGVKRSLFYLGEVLVTECKVMINGSLGIGMVKGYEEELAYNLAVIDAAYQAGLPETDTWTEELLAEEERLGKQAAEAAGKILKTKVNFETMNV